MGSSFGSNFKVTIFGQSHSAGMGVVIDGLPVGFEPDFDAVRAFMSRRAPGKSPLATPRRESDDFEIISGLYGGKLCGGALSCVIRNNDCASGDYKTLEFTPRPGHADYTSFVKYAGHQDIRGGGHLSGRLTAPLCFAGAVAIQLLEKKGVKIAAHILRIGNVNGRAFDPLNPEIDALIDDSFRVLDARVAQAMKTAIENAKADGDSVSGDIECAVTGLPAGLGDPMFDGLENVISRAVFAIPGVKGITFGNVENLGSENNDAFYSQNGRVYTKTNHCGGIQGGISNGMPLIFKAAVKPTPSISKIQRTVDLREMRETSVEIKGRHDPCIVPRAVPAVEAAVAIAVCDCWMRRSAEKWI